MMQTKKTDDEVKVFNEHFYKIFEMSPSATIITEIEDGKIQNANTAFCKLFKVDAENIKGKTAVELNLISADVRNAQAKENIKKGGVRGVEIIMQDANHQQKSILLSSDIIDLENKKYFLSTLVDITEHKKNVDSLKHLASIVESSDDAIFSKSIHGIIQTWNKGAEKMYGYSRTEAIGKHISIIIPPDYLDEEKIINKKINNNESIVHYETVR
ncbi:MAG: PAS domain S-box protein, partial [Bacteroidetes bacterium]|nr:PAS domain S-box protein [Bacteroidota bacterium]